MYARKVKGRTLTFGVSGKLWSNSLVMIDHETGSFWSHMLGEAMKGPLVGTKLEAIPSVMTTWKAWKSDHPETTVLSMPRTHVRYVRESLRRDDGLVIGLAKNGQSRTWDLSLLVDHPVVNDAFLKDPVLVLFDQKSFTATIYDRKLDDRILSFHLKDGKLRDRETKSEWNPRTGVAITGPMKDKPLKLRPGIISDAAAWAQFHPDNATNWRWKPKKQSATSGN